MLVRRDGGQPVMLQPTGARPRSRRGRCRPSRAPSGCSSDAACATRSKGCARRRGTTGNRNRECGGTSRATRRPHPPLYSLGVGRFAALARLCALGPEHAPERLRTERLDRLSVPVVVRIERVIRAHGDDERPVPSPPSTWLRACDAGEPVALPSPRRRRARSSTPPQRLLGIGEVGRPPLVPCPSDLDVDHGPAEALFGGGAQPLRTVPSLTATACDLNKGISFCPPTRAFSVFAIPDVPTPGPEPGMESARLACAGGRADTVVTAVAGVRITASRERPGRDPVDYLRDLMSG